MSETTKTVEATHSVPTYWPLADCRAAARMSSLLKKPEVGGIPASAASPIVVVQNVHGIDWRNPPIAESDVEPIANMRQPAARNRSALKAPCDSKWSIPASRPPTDIAANM